MTNQPTSIAEAFTTWTALLAAELAAQTDTEKDAISLQRTGLERAAVTLPAITARDVWQLLAMTTDLPDLEPGDQVFAADEVITRAHCEAATA